MLLFLLFACAPERTGVYDVTYGAPEGECAEMPAIAPGTLGLEPSEDGVVVLPLGELCPRVEDGFACELASWDSDLAYPGVDARMTVDVDLVGAWTTPAEVVGSVEWTVACEGADCATIAEVAPEPCATRWSWTGEHLPQVQASACGAPTFAPAGHEIEALGEAPWDPVHVGGTDLHVLTVDDVTVAYPPLVVDGLVTAEAGLHLVAPELVDEDLARAGYWTDLGAAWATDAMVCTAPTVPRWVDVPSRLAEIGTFGREPGFTPDAIVGAWNIDVASLIAGGNANVGGLVGGFLTGLRLEVLDVADGEAEIRLVAPTYADDGECVLLHDHAALSSTGELTWSTDRIEAAAEPAPLVLHEPRIRLGFDGSERAAGGEVSAIVDVRATVGHELDLCALGVSFGARCEPCPDDGEPYCLALAGFAWTGAHAEAPVGVELPMCGVDFTDTGVVPDVEIDCEPSGGSCAVAWIALLLPVFRRRSPPRG